MRPIFPLLALFLTSLAFGADPISPPDDGHGWVRISDPILQKLAADQKKIPWPGATTGVAVDAATGDVWVIPTGHGIWRSKDHGKTYDRLDGEKISGRCETGYAINPDPAGSRFAFFMLDGKGGMTLDGGKTWSQFKDVGRNWDFAAVDWSDAAAKTIFAERHESGGELYLSTDAGQSWKQIGKQPKVETIGGLGIFPGPVLVMTAGDGILRSTDSGASWTKVSDLQPTGRIMRIKNNIGYWVSTTGIITSKDNGQTWQQWGSKVEAAGWGPYFGKDDKQIVITTKKNFLETHDAGQTWQTIAPMPAIKDFAPSRLGWFLQLSFDPNANLLYASRMGFATYKMELK